MKRLYTLFLICFTVSCWFNVADAQTVRMPDTNLAAAVREALDLGPNANLTKQKMRKLTQLTANEAGIKDLTGLEHATQLRSLSLVGNQIRDVSPLAGLKNLQVLSLSDNWLEGTGPLFTLLKRNPNLELDITIPMEEHPPIYWFTGILTDQNENITRPAYIQRLTSVSANVETLWESTSPIRSNTFEPNTRQLAVDTVAGKLYWTEEIDGARSELKWANLDGSELETLKTLSSVVTSIAVDTKNRKLYWANSKGRIQRANLNGQQVKTLVNEQVIRLSDSDTPTNLTVDVDGGKLYWAEGSWMWRSDLNGKNITNVITGSGLPLSGLAVADGKIYWVQSVVTGFYWLGGRILRADLNGSNVEELIASPNLFDSDLAVDPAGGSLYYTTSSFSIDSHILRRDLNGNSEDEIVVYYEGRGGPSQIVLGIPPASLNAGVTRNTDTSGDSVVAMPDATLAAAVRKALNLGPNAAITQQAMKRLTTLSVGGGPIKNLTGLEHATQLRYLHLRYHQIQDIYPLEGLTQLTDLHIDHNPITDLKPLASLKQLKSLGVSVNKIGTLRKHVDLTQLVRLDVEGSKKPIAGLNLVGNLKQLKRLSISRAKVKNISFLKGLTQLENLTLWNNQISNLAPLAKLTKLTTLSLSSNRISDVAPLTKLTKLTTLFLDNNRISDVTPLAKLTKLTTLSLRNNRISDVTPLAKLTKLEGLFLKRNPIQDASPLRSLTKLKRVDIEIPGRAGAAPARTAVPDQTLLLANYPNPFNPETWIPYQLAIPADVQITIYDARGVLIRRMELGHQAAGTYTSRSRAAYWDGRNNQGERIASGIYFYQFRAGNVSSSRKMLILK